MGHIGKQLNKANRRRVSKGDKERKGEEKERKEKKRERKKGGGERGKRIKATRKERGERIGGWGC